MDNDKKIDVLNDLIEINNDRIEGYEKASKETDEMDLRNLFSSYIRTSQRCRSELIDEVRALGGTPAEGTKVSGKFYRAWMDIKAAITGRDRKTILDSCEYGEDVAVDAYDKAVKDFEEIGGNMSSPLHALLIRQRNLIKADHDQVRSLRDMEHHDVRH
ncbi:MAG: ferritin-like domain-containing protein [Methylococcaceae bacterium]|nr:PA2169 family four-helix-bundle protein [Prolixibacteraceae bacterium]